MKNNDTFDLTFKTKEDYLCFLREFLQEAIYYENYYLVDELQYKIDALCNEMSFCRTKKL